MTISFNKSWRLHIDSEREIKPVSQAVRPIRAFFRFRRIARQSNPDRHRKNAVRQLQHRSSFCAQERKIERRREYRARVGGRKRKKKRNEARRGAVRNQNSDEDVRELPAPASWTAG